MVLAATNRPSNLDEAILRCLPQVFEIGKPNRGDKANILKVILKGERIDDNIDFDHIVSLCECSIGCDLLDVCKQAAYFPVRDFLQDEKNGKRPHVLRALSQLDLEKAFIAARKTKVVKNECSGLSIGHHLGVMLIMRDR
ncbi:unnamed protein product [Ilex paraguariensis]|uniref:ATPase AAA-type core domain-containing protein n=1 Tax=Ilex paraguariensis TaxID=185542 RepID=A0ABC8TJA9_9AQUA